MRSVVLLRGVNVGGRNKVPMAALADWLRVAGFSSVTTYIQSGNVVLEHSRAVDVGAVVHRAIIEHTGHDIRVLVTSATELREIVDANPYDGLSPTQLHVSFFEHAPDASVLARLAATDWSPEEFSVAGRVLYLHLPHGMGRSVMVPRLTVLKEATTRNWNTVLALSELASR